MWMHGYYCAGLGRHNKVLSQKLVVPQLAKDYPTLHTTRKFITVFTKPPMSHSSQ